jgi:starch phosphorylase
MNLLERIPVAPVQLEIPVALQGIERLALNLYWRRERSVRSLFERLDPELWAADATPVQVLLQSKKLGAAAGDGAFVSDLRAELARFDRYLAESGKRKYSKLTKNPIAYFCAEFGFQSRVALYCGGLGILAGDHCMEASDMGLPFVAVGLFYRRGFFKQVLDRDGRQQHSDPVLEPGQAGLQRVLDPATQMPLNIAVELPGRTVQAAAWVIAVGNVPVILLDTDLAENSPEDRKITSQLYVVGRVMRLCQETVLGVGGVRALYALGIEPAAFHLNEGHSALLLLERVRRALGTGSDWDAALEQVRASSVLTIHTPVPEGNERFDAHLTGSFVQAIAPDGSIPPEKILKLGLDSKSDPKIFDMTAFALRLTHAANGVSVLHGRTADGTWRKVAKRPLVGVTNGVHMPTWIGPEVRALLEAEGATFEPLTEAPTTPGKNGRGRWAAVEQISDGDLWRAHATQKLRFIEFVRERLFEQHARYGENPSELRAYSYALDPEALIIGFSRRFAPYKRATLMFSDERRLSKLLNSKDRPVQIVFSGKAYPTDREGQAMLAKLYMKSLSNRFKGKVFILEDYDMEVAEKLVQGVDLWLNNPRRPMEASGTSGMKAAANGVPNASILDGWWDEGYESGRHRNGFAIGGRKAPSDPTKQDAHDAADLYRVLEEEVVPTFFHRDASGLPKAWVKVMKNSIADSLCAFSTRRMIEDYLELHGLA